MHAWPVQDAKARFSKFLDACISDGRSLCRIAVPLLPYSFPSHSESD